VDPFLGKPEYPFVLNVMSALLAAGARSEIGAGKSGRNTQIQYVRFPRSGGGILPPDVFPLQEQEREHL
jgi:hypothetical protein